MKSRKMIYRNKVFCVYGIIVILYMIDFFIVEFKIDDLKSGRGLWVDIVLEYYVIEEEILRDMVIIDKFLRVIVFDVK